MRLAEFEHFECCCFHLHSSWRANFSHTSTNHVRAVTMFDSRRRYASGHKLFLFYLTLFSCHHFDGGWLVSSVHISFFLHLYWFLFVCCYKLQSGSSLLKLVRALHFVVNRLRSWSWSLDMEIYWLAVQSYRGFSSEPPSRHFVVFLCTFVYCCWYFYDRLLLFEPHCYLNFFMVILNLLSFCVHFDKPVHVSLNSRSQISITSEPCVSSYINLHKCSDNSWPRVSYFWTSATWVLCVKRTTSRTVF